MKRKQLYKMILLELYDIYCVSVPIGILGGLGVAWLVLFVSGDRSTEVYLCNETVKFRMIIPAWQIIECVVVIFLLSVCLGIYLEKGYTVFCHRYNSRERNRGGKTSFLYTECSRQNGYIVSDELQIYHERLKNKWFCDINHLFRNNVIYGTCL